MGRASGIVTRIVTLPARRGRGCEGEVAASAQVYSAQVYGAQPGIT